MPAAPTSTVTPAAPLLLVPLPVPWREVGEQTGKDGS